MTIFRSENGTHDLKLQLLEQAGFTRGSQGAEKFSSLLSPAAGTTLQAIASGELSSTGRESDVSLQRTLVRDDSVSGEDERPPRDANESSDGERGEEKARRSDPEPVVCCFGGRFGLGDERVPVKEKSEREAGRETVAAGGELRQGADGRAWADADIGEQSEEGSGDLLETPSVEQGKRRTQENKPSVAVDRAPADLVGQGSAGTDSKRDLQQVSDEQSRVELAVSPESVPSVLQEGGQKADRKAPLGQEDAGVGQGTTSADAKSAAASVPAKASTRLAAEAPAAENSSEQGAQRATGRVDSAESNAGDADFSGEQERGERRFEKADGSRWQEKSTEGPRVNSTSRVAEAALTTLEAIEPKSAAGLQPSTAAAPVPTANAAPPAGQASATGASSQASASVTATGFSTGNSGGARSSSSSPATPEAGRINQVEQRRLIQRVAQAFRVAQQRDGEMRLRLSPPELGSMRLEVRVQDQTLVARLRTETEAARQVISENLSVLRDRLAEQGITVERFDVEVQSDESDSRSGTHDADARHSAAGEQRERRGDSSGRGAPSRVVGGESVETREEASGLPSANTQGLNVVI